MYYFDCETTLQTSFTEKKTFSFHFIGRISVDYFNNNSEIELFSFPTKEDFINKENSFVTFLTVNDSPKFNVDPSLFALRCLIAVEESPFYHKEIKAWYELEHLSQLKTLFNLEETE